jgi:hypothetical protein
LRTLMMMGSVSCSCVKPFAFSEFCEAQAARLSEP